MFNIRVLNITMFGFLLVFSIAFGQQDSSAVGSHQFNLTISGEVDHPLQFSLGDLKTFPRQTVHVKDHDGNDVTYEGVALLELLHKAGTTLGKNLRGKALTNYVVVEAADDYRVVFALAEIDTEFAQQLIVLAYSKDNQPLSESDGPLQIIVPAEKRHARWVRQVRSLIIRRDDQSNERRKK